MSETIFAALVNINESDDMPQLYPVEPNVSCERNDLVVLTNSYNEILTGRVINIIRIPKSFIASNYKVTSKLTSKTTCNEPNKEENNNVNTQNIDNVITTLMNRLNTQTNDIHELLDEMDIIDIAKHVAYLNPEIRAKLKEFDDTMHELYDLASKYDAQYNCHNNSSYKSETDIHPDIMYPHILYIFNISPNN